MRLDPRRVFSLTALLWSAPLLAESAALGVSAGQGLKVLASLCLVIILLFVVLYSIRKLQGMTHNSGQMKLLSALPVGPREKVVLLQIGEEQFLVGVAQHSVNLLAKVAVNSESVHSNNTSDESNNELDDSHDSDASGFADQLSRQVNSLLKKKSHD